MQLCEVRTTDDGREEFFTFDLEVASNLNEIVYMIAELRDRSPHFKMKVESAFEALGLKLERVKL